MVAYVGTFSKVMFPQLRVDCVVAPPAILDAIVAAKHLTCGHTGTLTERALASFMEAGHLQKHIRRCREVYAGRRVKLLRRLGGDLSEWLEPVPISVGLHLTAFLRQPVDVPLLLRWARRADLGLYSIEPFYHDAEPRQGLLFGFGAIDTLDIDLALDRLRQLLVQA